MPLDELQAAPSVLDDAKLIEVAASVLDETKPLAEDVILDEGTAALSSASSGASKSFTPSLASVHPNTSPSSPTAFPLTKPCNCAPAKSTIVSNPVRSAVVTFVHVAALLALAVKTA
ncbi:hypothetical protein A1F99_096750 [Pyrenophora tritici-repentis]|nr:hypothetical protein A1F99_096750 [Pyrenophora tritici-repentis]